MECSFLLMTLLIYILRSDLDLSYCSDLLSNLRSSLVFIYYSILWQRVVPWIILQSICFIYFDTATI